MKVGQFILSLCLVIPGLWVLFAPAIVTEPIPPKSVVVEYWEKWTGVEGEQMRIIVDQYNRTQGREKGIYVRYISMSSIDRKTLISTAGGAPPDIAGLWADQVPQYAMLDALSPLGELASQHGIGDSTFKKVYWNKCNYDGTLYALPSSPAAVTIQWNRRLFWQNADKLRAAGLDPARAPQTIDELDRYAQVFDIREGNRIRRTGYLPTEPGWYVNYTGLWFGTPLFDEAAQRWLFDTPEMIRAFEWLQSYPKRLGTESVSNFRSGFGNYTSAQNPFLIGEVVMIQQGPWLATYLEQFKPDMNRLLVPRSLEVFLPETMRTCNYAWATEAFPSASPQLKDVTHCGFDVFVIPKAAKHKMQAFDFISYCMRQDIYEKLQQLKCANSALANVSKSFSRYHPNPFISVYERVASGPHAYYDPQSPVRSEVFSHLTAMLDKISLLKIEPAEGMRQLQETATKITRRYDEEHRIRQAKEIQ